MSWLFILDEPILSYIYNIFIYIFCWLNVEITNINSYNDYDIYNIRYDIYHYTILVEPWRILTLIMIKTIDMITITKPILSVIKPLVTINH